MPHLDRDLTAYYTGREGNLNAPSIIGKSDKQEDLHLNAGGSGTDTCCIWITAGELVGITGRTHLAFFSFGVKAKLAASCCQVPFSSLVQQGMSQRLQSVMYMADEPDNDLQHS